MLRNMQPAMTGNVFTPATHDIDMEEAAVE